VTAITWVAAPGQPSDNRFIGQRFPDQVSAM
jgi:hypothetical protein